MQIRWKLLILLLTIALVPLALVAWLDVRSTRALGREFAANTRRALSEGASEQLLQLTRDYGRLVEARKSSVELALRLAVSEAERALAAGIPLDAARPTLDLIEREYGSLIDRQRLVLLEGAVLEQPPGAPSTQDARDSEAVLSALVGGGLVWIAPRTRAGAVSLTASMPIRDADRVMIGAACIDLRVDALLSLLEIPGAWKSGATVALLSTTEVDEDGEPIEEPVVLLRRTHGAGRAPEAVEAGPLEAPPGEAGDALVADLKATRTGVQRMAFRNESSVWAYGPAGERGLHAVIIVPRALIIAGAVAAEASLLQRTARQLAVAGGVLVLALGAVVIASVAASRSVTRPIRALVRAAQRIADGDLEARVDIATGDELENLGKAFNAMAPKLRDRVRLRESLALAMEVQQSLLPGRPPTPAGFDLAGRSVYCDETGGDYYDFLDLSDQEPGLVGVAVGDVSGHGVSAALLMTTARAILRSNAGEPGSLADLVIELNRQLSGDTMRGRFMTLFLAVIGGESGAMRFVSAGHDPAIVYDPEADTFTELTSDDIPLGIRPDWRYEELSRPGPAGGENILIGTDGLWDTRSPRGEHFGKDRLREVIRQNHARSAEQIAEAVIDAVDDFRGREAQRVDLTLVVIKRPGVASAAGGRTLAAAN